MLRTGASCQSSALSGGLGKSMARFAQSDRMFCELWSAYHQSVVLAVIEESIQGNESGGMRR